MISKISIKGMDYVNILEPSAGKGDMIEYLSDNYNKDRVNVFALENDEQLFEICQGKGIQMLGKDFLTFNSDYLFDVIIMNPPFDNGIKHLLKAWSLIEYSGGQIICLLNKSNLENIHTKRKTSCN